MSNSRKKSDAKGSTKKEVIKPDSALHHILEEIAKKVAARLQKKVVENGRDKKTT